MSTVPPVVGRRNRHGRRTWRLLLAAALIIAAAAVAFSATHRSADRSQQVCDRLRLPGLTTTEGRQIIAEAADGGVGLAELRQHCAALIDGFNS